MARKKLKAIADRGYYSGTQIKACDDADIAVILPKVTTPARRLMAVLIEQSLSILLGMTSICAQSGNV